ncbi:diguanylate cyclase/phosphodiesterase (GGDEF & EAL domains) with PAS/PAC sensor(s), partial [hydrothermal vent metagenome]
EFPVEVLKIDRSFVANIDRGRRFVALVHAAAQLASNLGMEVVAEGIEDADQVAVLQSMGCEFGQGYFFSKPMKAAEVPGFLTSWEETRKKAA